MTSPTHEPPYPDTVQWKKIPNYTHSAYNICAYRIRLGIMTSSSGTIFRITGPLCGEFTGPDEFPAQRPVTRSFDVFFDMCLNKRLSHQPWGWWFETPPWSLWHQCNGESLFPVESYFLSTIGLSVSPFNQFMIQNQCFDCVHSSHVGGRLSLQSVDQNENLHIVTVCLSPEVDYLPVWVTTPYPVCSVFWIYLCFSRLLHWLLGNRSGL